MTEAMLNEVQVLRVVLRTRQEHPTLPSANFVAYSVFPCAYQKTFPETISDVLEAARGIVSGYTIA
jgi:hypothetical protein